jgi:DNA-binding MarR family transcriptional regulator
MAKSKQAASSAKPARSARDRAAAGKEASPVKPARNLTRSAKREPQKSTGETKQARVIAILERDTGATLAELIAVTGWLPHTTRATLTGLRRKGFVLDKSKREDGTTVYRITSTPASDARQAG